MDQNLKSENFALVKNVLLKGVVGLSAFMSATPLLAQTQTTMIPKPPEQVLAPQASKQQALAEQASKQQDSFEEAFQKARTKNPAGLKFTIDLGGKTRFHRGEIIPIHLNFSSDAPLGFKLDPRNYDRSGRLNLTDFFITDRPQDTPDPLGTYFNTNPFGFMGGLSAIPKVVGPKVQTIRLTLNEYLRFDQPGHFRLYVLSRRLFPAEQQFGGMFGGTPAASDVIEFDIEEGDEWAQHRSREIEAILSAPANKAAPANAEQNEVRHGDLAGELRFLDTPLSRRLMIANYGNPNFRYTGDFHFGLIGTREPLDAIAAMREHLQNPGGAVTSAFLQDLTTLLFMQSDAPALPRYPSKAAQDSAEVKQYQAIATLRDQKRRDITQALLDDLGRALPSKRGMARAVTLTTMIEGLSAAQKLFYGANAVSDEPALQTLRRQLLRSWNDLPRESQKTLLNYRWPLIRDPALLPLLVRANDAPWRVNPNQSDNFQEREWRSLLLLRISQLPPIVGRQYAQTEMKRPDPRVDIGMLLDWPDSPLPASVRALETVWLKNLRNPATDYNDSERVAQLIVRYASPQIAAPLKTWFDKTSDIGDAPRRALLAYFARVRPAQIGAMIEAEIAAHQQPVFEAIGAFNMNDRVEAVAIQYLQGANRYLAADAARALSAYGSDQVEAVLWARLEKWHAGLQGKTLDNTEIEFETTLVQALASMPGVQTQAHKSGKVARVVLVKASARTLERNLLSQQWLRRARDSLPPGLV